MALIPGYLTATWQNSSGSGNNYSYVALGGIANYAIVAGDFLEYDVYWESGPVANLQIGMDLICTNGNTLRDTNGQTDQSGRSAHPSADLSSVATGQWYSRRIPLSGLVASTISNFDIVCEGDSAGTYVGRFRNMRIINGTTTKVSIYESRNPGSTVAAPSTSTGTGPGNNGTSLTSLVATAVVDVAVQSNGTASAYGASSYGGSTNISAAVASNAQAATSAGRSTVTMGMSVVPRAGDIVVIPVTAGDQPSDILLEPQQGPNSITAQSSGAATVTMGQGERYSVQARPAGVAGGTINMGERYRTLTTSNGQAGARSLNGLFTNSWYLGSPFRVTSAAAGAAGCINNTITTYSGAVFTSRVFLYPSTTPPDVNLAPETGPGATKSMVSTNQGIGHMTALMGGLQRLVSTSAGRTVVTAYLGSPFHIFSTAAGVAGARDQFGATGKWYLGSPLRISSLAAGRTAFTNNYLGSPFHVSMASAGRAGGFNYLGSRIYISAAAAGRGGARDVFGTSGRWYLGSPVRISSTSAGRGGSTKNYLSSRVFAAAISAGRAGGSLYLSSPLRLSMAAAGRATLANYLGSRVYWLFGSWYSNGRAGGQNYLASPFNLPAATSHGISNNSLHKPGLVYGVLKIAGRATGSAYQLGFVRILAGQVTSRGVATMFLDPGLLYMTSNGVGHVNNIPRPTGVFMEWSAYGVWYYERHFPYIEALKIPKGSNGMSYVSIEIDTIPIMHQHSNGVGGMTQIQAGIERHSQWQTVIAGCYDWYGIQDNTDPDIPQTHYPWFGTVGALNVAENDFVYRRYPGAKEHPSFSATLTPVPVVWNPNGIAKCKMHPTINFYRRWQTWTDGEPFYTYPGYGGLPHPYVDPDGNSGYGATRRAGGVGTMSFRGPRKVAGIAYGVGNVGVINRLGVRYASNLHAIAVATFRNTMGGGTPATLDYGNMLRYFFIPTPQAGQFWPRRERFVQPV